MDKQTVAVFCGGQSVEHEISLLSAKNVFQDLPETFNKCLVYISREGQWFYVSSPNVFFDSPNAQAEGLLLPLILKPGSADPILFESDNTALSIDCVFPVLHGTNGEDGTIQGLFELLNLPYVGCGVIGAAVCMEKHLTKEIVRQHGIPTLDWIMVDKYHQTQYRYDELVAKLGETLFIKPTRLGSALGISKVSSADAYHAAMLSAFEVDHRVIIEPAVNAREIELSVIGNENPVASLPGEVVVYDDFYTYEAKYFDAEKSKVVSPVSLPEALIEGLQMLAVDTYKALLCQGMARVDFFLIGEDKLVLNEVNPIPGFTDISMYPKNWAASGLTYAALLTRLIDLALEVHQHKQQLLLIPTSQQDTTSQSL